MTNRETIAALYETLASVMNALQAAGENPRPHMDKVYSGILGENGSVDADRGPDKWVPVLKPEGAPEEDESEVAYVLSRNGRPRRWHTDWDSLKAAALRGLGEVENPRFHEWRLESKGCWCLWYTSAATGRMNKSPYKITEVTMDA